MRVEEHPSQKEHLPAAKRETNFMVLLELCLVPKEWMCRLGTAQEPLAKETSRNGNTAYPLHTKPGAFSK